MPYNDFPSVGLTLAAWVRLTPEALTRTLVNYAGAGEASTFVLYVCRVLALCVVIVRVMLGGGGLTPNILGDISHVCTMSLQSHRQLRRHSHDCTWRASLRKCVLPQPAGWQLAPRPRCVVYLPGRIHVGRCTPGALVRVVAQIVHAYQQGRILCVPVGSTLEDSAGAMGRT